MRIVNLSNLPTFTAVNVSEDPGAIGGPVIIPSCAQIALRWSLEGGKTAHQVLVGRYSGAFSGTQAQANTIFTQLSTGTAAAAFLTHIGINVTFAGVDIRDVNTAFQPLIQSNATGVPGTGAGTALPNEVALVATLRTALAGRQNRGRSYMVGFLTSLVSPGNVVAPVLMTDAQAWANTWSGALGNNGYTLVIGQKARQAYTGRTGTAHPARPANSVPVTSVLIRDNHWDTQRRRGLK